MNSLIFLGARLSDAEVAVFAGGFSLYLLLEISLVVLAVAFPFMFWAMHRNLKSTVVVLKHHGKVLEAINTNLISISQQINHFGTGQPMPRAHAPAPSARVEAPRNGLRR